MLGKVNEEFLVNNLENKRYFTDLCIHADDVQEIADFSKNTLQKMGYFIASVDSQNLDGKSINHIINPEEDTPSKLLIKGVKKVNLGSKYPLLWKLGAGFTALTFFYYLFFSTIAIQAILGTVMLGSSALSAGAFMLRENLNITLWIKSIGVTRKSEGGRFKLFIAGDLGKDNPVAQDYLSENFAEIKDNYVRNFMKYNAMEGFVKTGDDVNSMIDLIHSIQKEIKITEDSFHKDELSGEEYKKRTVNLEKQRANMLLAVELLSNTK